MVVYVQIKSAWQGDRWRTVCKTEDKEYAKYLKEGLKISEHEFGERSPGLAGVRYARIISRKNLAEDDGLATVVQAEADVRDGWSDDSVPARHSQHERDEYGNRVWMPHRQVVYKKVAADVAQLEILFQEEE